MNTCFIQCRKQEKNIIFKIVKIRTPPYLWHVVLCEFKGIFPKDIFVNLPKEL